MGEGPTLYFGEEVMERCGWCRNGPGVAWILGFPGDYGTLLDERGEPTGQAFNLLLCRECTFARHGWTFDRAAQKWRPNLPSSIRA